MPGEPRGELPDYVMVACVGGGSNAAGIFVPFVEDKSVKLIGVEAGGRGNAHLASTRRRFALDNRACCTARSVMCCRMKTGRRRLCTSVSAGLDYPGVGPEHAYWKERGGHNTCRSRMRRRWRRFNCRAAGGNPAGAGDGPCALRMWPKLAPKLGKDQIIIVCLSGRGDKDCQEVARLIGDGKK
jgi:tryptophan synthase beta chain